MKYLLILIFCAFLNQAFSQDIRSTKIVVNVYIPAFSKSILKKNDNLIVYLTPVTDSTINVPKKIVAKKLDKNQFEIDLPNTDYLIIGFGIGNFSENLTHILNQAGNAFEDNQLYLLLNEEKYQSPRFIAPIIKDE